MSARLITEIERRAKARPNTGKPAYVTIITQSGDFKGIIGKLDTGSGYVELDCSYTSSGILLINLDKIVAVRPGWS
jgi:hypothetical protein